jgi:RimJ/RimL family protein N-acetyltransferase
MAVVNDVAKLVTIHGYELGYVIHDRRDWGKGYASEGLRLLSDRLFAERPAMVRHQFTVSCENVASWKVAERCGFAREGILRASGFGAPPENSFMYSRVRAPFDRS